MTGRDEKPLRSSDNRPEQGYELFGVDGFRDVVGRARFQALLAIRTLAIGVTRRMAASRNFGDFAGSPACLVTVTLSA